MHNLNPKDFTTDVFDWGRIKWRVSPDITEGGASMTVGDVMLFPNKGHDRHNHPDDDEMIYVLSGHGRQMIDDREPFDVAAGDMFYIPRTVYHSTLNTGWAALQLLVVYTPGGAERALRQLPDYWQAPVGKVPAVGNLG
ncbi:MAG: cupin domain-containing protein [Roseitalea sp.]|jgi:oxalate decarboxylase/phosphoglucose isomerase-like protein (cupin superfamily)|nr:cupin domain-containing protein [Roseitalea sp.]MBO6720771.1 cupin domain-containing protein [Roseitalea sp.]MBO6743918.1 cupin domain-containing protein [Roseitalea sp.]